MTPHDHHGHDHGHHHHAPPRQQAVPVARPVSPAAPASITISERAAKELKAAMTAEGVTASALRLDAQPGGCAGFQYALSFAEHAEPGEVSAESAGVKVFINQTNLGILNGITIDYVDTPMGSGFNIKNPNAKSTCGCGNTFDA